MGRPELMVIVIAALVVLLALMVLGWRARKARQSAVTAPLAGPAELGAVIGTFEGKYVATTAAGDPLDRIAVHGLGFRGTVALLVAESGILVRISGAEEFWIPAADVREQRRATWTIDRVVERDGLDLLQWTLGDRTVESYFRLNDRAAFALAVGHLLERTAA